MSKVHWLALATLPGIGAVTIARLVERFGDVAAVFDASDADLRQIPRVTDDVVIRLRAIDLDALDTELSSLADDGISVLTWDDADYPAALRGVPDAPPLLFALGQVEVNDVHAVAIVGTREPSRVAADLAEGLACELAARGVTIVSGLAQGIDTAAHRGALAAPGGRTLAVLGSGVRVIHPRENATLAEAIAAHGAVLSEFLPNTPPRGPQLMARDRIISGLSRAVLVVEAGEGSGSLDTAARAKRQGRAVFAVPGSAGTDALLTEGAAALDPQTANLDALVKEWLGQHPLEASPQVPKQLGLW